MISDKAGRLGHTKKIAVPIPITGIIANIHAIR